jgi:hypothetical protein
LCDEPCSTTPKRKPLTDEEIDKLLGPLPRYADEWSMTDFIRFARAIEAATALQERRNELHYLQIANWKHRWFCFASMQMWVASTTATCNTAHMGWVE